MVKVAIFYTFIKYIHFKYNEINLKNFQNNKKLKLSYSNLKFL